MPGGGGGWVFTASDLLFDTDKEGWYHVPTTFGHSFDEINQTVPSMMLQFNKNGPSTYWLSRGSKTISYVALNGTTPSKLE